LQKFKVLKGIVNRVIVLRDDTFSCPLINDKIRSKTIKSVVDGKFRVESSFVAGLLL
jgi:hypothetical protein